MAWRGVFALLVGAGLAVGCDKRSDKPSPTAPPPADRSDGTIPLLHAAAFPAGAVRIDGKLDEPVWEQAGATGGLVHPGSGRPEPGALVNGEARVGWDERALYVAFRVEDPEPAAPFRRGDPDPHVWEGSSGIELMLQPGDPGDNREYFEIQLDTACAQWSTAFDDYNRPISGEGPERRYGHQEWNPALECAAFVEPGVAYTVEFALPWSDVPATRTASPPKPGDVWRMNFYAFRDGQNQALAWSPILGEGNFHRSSRFGQVRFEPPTP